MQARIEGALAADGHVNLFPMARQLAMEVSMRFVLGDALTERAASALMADYCEYAQGVFSPVRLAAACLLRMHAHRRPHDAAACMPCTRAHWRVT
jgi:hypothetical protein